MYEFDINVIHDGVSNEWLEKYECFDESASINEAMGYNGALCHEFRPIWPGIRMSTKKTPGKINVPIIIGGVRIEPGDLIFADNDAVVCVPKHDVERVYNTAFAREEMEEAKRLKVVNDPAETTYSDLYRNLVNSFGLKVEPGAEI